MRSGFVIGLASMLSVAGALTPGATGQDRDASATSPEGATSAPALDPAPVSLFVEPDLLSRAIAMVGPYVSESGRARSTGFYPSAGGLITGAGWLSAGPGYRQWFGYQAYVDASAEVSVHTYKQAQVRFELPRLARGHVAAGTQLLWRDLTQVHYFGVGEEGPGAPSEYRLKTTDMTGYADYQATRWLSLHGQVGWLDRPTVSSGAGWLDSGYEPPTSVYPDDPGVGVRPPSYVHADIAITADTRDYPGYPRRGSVIRASWSTFADRDLASYSFSLYQFEAAHVRPVVNDRWTLALHGWSALADVGQAQAIPFFLLPTLGGDNTLRGDRNYRWHDRNLLLLSVESRWPVFEHVDAAAFVDAGGVAHRPDGLGLTRYAWGAGLRVHTRTSTLVRLDLARGDHGDWHVTVKLSDPFRLSRFGQHTAPVPFLP